MKKVVLSFYLIAVFGSIGYAFLERGMHNIHLVNGFIEPANRIKRSDDTCALTCVMSMKSNIDNNVPELYEMIENMSNDPTSLSVMSKAQFQKYCKDIIAPYVACFDNCDSSSSLTTLLKKSTVPAKFICIDHYDEMYDNYDCLHNAQNVSKTECANGICKDLNQAPAKLIQQSKSLTRNGDYDGLKKLFADNCEYGTCTMHCEKPIITKMCSERIANLTENDLIGLTMKTSKEILASVNIEQAVWPAQCEKIITETGYGTTSPVIVEDGGEIN